MAAWHTTLERRAPANKPSTPHHAALQKTFPKSSATWRPHRCARADTPSRAYLTLQYPTVRRSRISGAFTTAIAHSSAIGSVERTLATALREG
jgi:hypothetical protein